MENDLLALLFYTDCYMTSWILETTWEEGWYNCYFFQEPEGD